jgi:hypothetical protein
LIPVVFFPDVAAQRDEAVREQAFDAVGKNLAVSDQVVRIVPNDDHCRFFDTIRHFVEIQHDDHDQTAKDDWKSIVV